MAELLGPNLTLKVDYCGPLFTKEALIYLNYPKYRFPKLI